MKARFRIAPGLHEQCGIESLEGRFQGCLVGTMGSISLRFAGGSPSSGSRRCRVSAMARTSGSGGIWGCSAFIFFCPVAASLGLRSLKWAISPLIPRPGPTAPRPTAHKWHVCGGKTIKGTESVIRAIPAKLLI
jgi:hypothetical protein